jgi:hypothetical protein
VEFIEQSFSARALCSLPLRAISAVQRRLIPKSRAIAFAALNQALRRLYLKFLALSYYWEESAKNFFCPLCGLHTSEGFDHRGVDQCHPKVTNAGFIPVSSLQHGASQKLHSVSRPAATPSWMNSKFALSS